MNKLIKKLIPFRRRAILILALFAVSLFAASQAAFAWSYHTHRKIVSDALNRMPASFFQRFGPFKERILKGSTDPDTILKDFMCHVYQIGEITRDCENRVKSLFNEGTSLLRSGQSDGDAAYTLGLIGHYIADINQPLHTAGSRTDLYESEYHSAFEKDVQGQLSKIRIGDVCYNPVTNPLDRLEKMARVARPFYESIGQAYRTGNKIFDLKDMVDRQYTAAVQNVVDYWLGMLKAAGQDSGGTGASPALLQVNETAPESVSRLATGERLAVNINTATIEQLKDLPGIGEKRAKAIIEARPFKTIYDLAKVQPYGKRLFDVKLIDRISSLIRVDP